MERVTKSLTFLFGTDTPKAGETVVICHFGRAREFYVLGIQSITWIDDTKEQKQGVLAEVQGVVGKEIPEMKETVQKDSFSCFRLK